MLVFVCGVGQKERLQAITLDLDEEVSVQLETVFAINGTKGIRDSTSTGTCQSTTETNDFSGTSIQMNILPRPLKLSSSVWGALDIVHLFTVRDVRDVGRIQRSFHVEVVCQAES